MRIARVLTRLNLGGPARQALAADTCLTRRGHEVRLFVGSPEPGEGDLYDTFRERGLDVVRVPGLRRRIAPARDLWVRHRLKVELAAFRPDVLHTHASKAGTLGRQAIDRARGFERTARVHTFHGHVLEGYFPRAISRRLIAHETRLAARTDRIVAVSHATAEDLLRLGVVEESRLVVVPPGVELDELTAIRRGDAGVGTGARPANGLRELVGAEPEDVLVGVVGRLAAVKRPELALEVFEQLRARFRRLHLCFVGDGAERARLERRIAALDEDGRRRVHLVGARADVAEVFAGLDALLATSRSEGLPVALIEAAGAGLPVVSTDVGGVAEVVVHERTGFLATTVDELAFGLGRLLEQPDERLAMGGRARMRIVERHSAERLATRLEELYEVVAEERRAGKALPGAAR